MGTLSFAITREEGTFHCFYILFYLEVNTMFSGEEDIK